MTVLLFSIDVVFIFDIYIFRYFYIRQFYFHPKSKESAN